MVCGGFACSKNCLCALNLLYTVRRGGLRGTAFGGQGCPAGLGESPAVCVWGVPLPPGWDPLPPREGSGGTAGGGRRALGWVTAPGQHLLLFR